MPEIVEDKMRHIALLLPAMRMGGAEKICLNFLDILIKEYKVTMILSVREGDLLPLIPECVDIIEDRLLEFKEVVKNDIRELSLKNLWKDFLYYLKVKTGHDSEQNYRYLVSRTPSIKEHYDCAISYVANVSTQIFCLADRISADKKIAWIHGETTEIKDTAFFSKYYQKFDKIYAVSEVTRSHFIKRFPECKKNTDIYYNPICRKDVLDKADEDISYEFDDSLTNIVTVGRLTPEKGIDMIPEITSLLLNAGYKIHWFVIGDGTCKEDLLKKIAQNHLNAHITLTGNQLNPYPFIKRCDIYVQPSYEEGYSTTICEAGILGKAIIGTTTSGGIREQIENGVSGLLAEPTPGNIANKIAEIIKDKNLKQNLEKNVLLRDYSNSDEFQKLKYFINGGRDDN